MPSKNNIDDPRHFKILEAVSKGPTNLANLSMRTELSKDMVERIVDDLSSQRLLDKVVRKGFFGNKKNELHITESGLESLKIKKQELYHMIEQLRLLYRTGDKKNIHSFTESNKEWMPTIFFMSGPIFSSPVNISESRNDEGNNDGSDRTEKNPGSSSTETASGDIRDSISSSDTSANGFNIGGFDSF